MNRIIGVNARYEEIVARMKFLLGDTVAMERVGELMEEAKTEVCTFFDLAEELLDRSIGGEST
jgi:hypothetical protein